MKEQRLPGERCASKRKRDTAVTAWAGEVMDEAMAIEGLLQSDGVVLGGHGKPLDAGSGPP